MASSLNEESVQKKLQSVTNAQDSIQSLSLWIIHHKTHHKEIVRLWLKVFKKAKAAQRLTLFYLCNDVVQNCKRKNAIEYRESFKEVIKAAAIFGRDETIKAKVERIFNIWKDRGVYDKSYIASLSGIMGTSMTDSGSSKSRKLAKSSKSRSSKHSSKKAEPPVEAYTPPVTPKTSTTTTTATTAKPVDPKVIADFKPSVVLEQMRTFSLLHQEVELRYRQLAHVRFDISSAEAVRQLKDRTHGKEFSQQFEDSCVKLEVYLQKQEEESRTRKALVEVLETAQEFYDEQYREAKIVANAYKNFGTRISNMSKRTTDLKKSLPMTMSPIPSPVLDAPSPDQTPKDDDNIQSIDMELSEEEAAAEVPSSGDAPSTTATPELQPAVYQAPSKKAVGDGLDKRLANMIPSLPMSHNSKSLSEQQDVFSHAMFSTPNKNSSGNDPNVFSGGSEGGSTPLSDERCSTPVQDEVPEVAPEEENEPFLPQVKESPIDILTKLINQAPKTTTNAESSFIQNLSLLTSGVKSQAEKVKQAKQLENDDTSEDKIDMESQRGPNTWASWKAMSSIIDESTRTPPRPIPSIQSSRLEQNANEAESDPQDPDRMEMSPLDDEEDDEEPQVLQQQAERIHIPPAATVNMQQAVSSVASSRVLPSVGPAIHLSQAAGHPVTAHAGGHPLIPPPRHLASPIPAPVQPHLGPGHSPLAPPLRPPPPQVPLRSPFPVPAQRHNVHLQPHPPGQRPPLHLPSGVPPHGAAPLPGSVSPQLAPPLRGPPVNYMPPRLNIPPPRFTSPPPSAGFNMSSPFIPQSSPGQKENWPSAEPTQSGSTRALVSLIGPDVPSSSNQRTPPSATEVQNPFSSPSANRVPPKGILRNSHTPVLKEVSQTPSQLTELMTHHHGPGPKPPSLPPSPADQKPTRHFNQPVRQAGEDLIEFTEKLKRKSAESFPEGRPQQPVFSRNSNRPNLTTITTVEIDSAAAKKEDFDKNSANNVNSVVDGPEDEKEEENEEEKKVEENTETEPGEIESENEPIQGIQPISTLGGAVRRVDNSDRDRLKRGNDDEERNPFENRRPPMRYESDYRDPYYDRPRVPPRYPPHRPPHPPLRAPFRRPYGGPRPYHDPYGPTPRKRAFPDPYDNRRPYYRY